jgi:hypothetical protein
MIDITKTCARYLNEACLALHKREICNPEKCPCYTCFKSFTDFCLCDDRLEYLQPITTKNMLDDILFKKGPYY